MSAKDEKPTEPGRDLPPLDFFKPHGHDGPCGDMHFTEPTDERRTCDCESGEAHVHFANQDRTSDCPADCLCKMLPAGVLRPQPVSWLRKNIILTQTFWHVVIKHHKPEIKALRAQLVGEKEPITLTSWLECSCGKHWHMA